jgi:hypothetical protein
MFSRKRSAQFILTTPHETWHNAPNPHIGHSQGTIMQEKDQFEDAAAM